MVGGFGFLDCQLFSDSVGSAGGGVAIGVCDQRFLVYAVQRDRILRPSQRIHGIVPSKSSTGGRCVDSLLQGDVPPDDRLVVEAHGIGATGRRCDGAVVVGYPVHCFCADAGGGTVPSIFGHFGHIIGPVWIQCDGERPSGRQILCGTNLAGQRGIVKHLEGELLICVGTSCCAGGFLNEQVCGGRHRCFVFHLQDLNNGLKAGI